MEALRKQFHEMWTKADADGRNEIRRYVKESEVDVTADWEHVAELLLGVSSTRVELPKPFLAMV